MWVFEGLQDDYFVHHCLAGVFISAQEVLLQYLDGHVMLRGFHCLRQIHFRRISFTEGAEHDVLAIENRHAWEFLVLHTAYCECYLLNYIPINYAHINILPM